MKYFVVFGNERYHPEDHFRACKNKFDILKKARAFARKYQNSYIFRMYDDGSVKDIKIFYTRMANRKIK